MEQKQEPAPKDKAEGSERPKPPPGFRKFRKMLKRVIGAPPMRDAIPKPSSETSARDGQSEFIE
jgi:hypothetical protein